MKITLIGSGNVATVLGRLAMRQGHSIERVISRNPDHARALAEEFKCSHDELSISPDASSDIYIVAVSDAGLQDIAHLHLHDRLVLHTAGSVSKDILKNISLNYGVLYPLQTLRKEMKNIPDIPFLVDGNSEAITDFILNFALSLSPLAQRSNDEDRLCLHAGAVLVSNFTNHLYALAEEFCHKEGVNFDLLKPLILETATRIKDISPSAVQTGPAIRKDIYTLDKHLKLFTNYPKLRLTYMRLTDSIMNP